MAGSIYRFLDKFLKSYSSKTFFIFTVFILISFFISEAIFVFYKVKKETEFIERGLKNASNIRAYFIKSRLDKLIKTGKFYNENYDTLPENCNLKDYRYVFCPPKWFIVKLKRNSYAYIEKRFIEDILDARKGMISIYNPVFYINFRPNRDELICKSTKIPESNITIYGCVSKNYIVFSILKSNLLEGTIFFFLFLTIGFLLFKVANKTIIYPINLLKKKLEEAEEKGINNVKFNTQLRDEFGELSKLLDDMSSSLQNYQNQLNLIIETTLKMTSMSNDIEKFIEFTVNSIEKIFPDTVGNGVYITKNFQPEKRKEIFSKKLKTVSVDEEEISNLIEKTPFDKPSVYKFYGKNLLIYRKKIDGFENIDYIYISDAEISNIKIEYLSIILSHLFYSINLMFLAHYDSLTLTLNRRAILRYGEKLEKQAINENKNFSIIIADIDDFKAINDTYGHFTGDVLLKLFANLLKDTLKEKAVVGRLGGEEFLIILGNTNHSQAIKIAKELREKVENQDFKIQDFCINITASFGVASFNEHGRTFSELLKSADISLYRAKRTGKNKVESLDIKTVNIILQREFKSKIELENILREDKIVPFYQPIHSMKDFSIIGYEVLARIKTDKGYISAYQFITDMIKFGLVEKLDLVVQYKALKYLSNKNIGTRLIFFNLSKAFIHKKENLDSFFRRCETFGIDTSNIVFEIVEEEAITDVDTVKSIIEKSKEKGVKFALDDFGVGYSTLSYIKHFDVDFIKIDGSLIRGIHRDKDKQIIIEGITFISKKKKVKTIAEMIEDENDLYTAKFLGVDYAQGYYLSKPSKEIIIQT